MGKKTEKALWTGLIVALSGTLSVFSDEKGEMIQFLSELNGTSGVSAAGEEKPVVPLQAELRGADPVSGDAKDQQITRLQSELKGARRQINRLEEELFIATDGQQFEEEEAAEELAEGIYPWTEHARRTPIGVLSPKTHTIPAGTVYARFLHISQNQSFVSEGKGDIFDDLFGLESQVKVGILIGYGITENWDVTIQRVNGRDYTGLDFEEYSFDLWDIMTKVQLMDEDDQYLDLSAAAGGTFFWQDNNDGLWAGNAALLAEKSIWRFRAGSGFLYTSLSDWDTTASRQSGALIQEKYYPNENTFGDPRPKNHTAAIPVNVSCAITYNQQLFSEAVFPVSGYDTGRGPSLAAGWRYSSPTHAYSIFLCNTSNGSFNSAITGGYRKNRLDVFGFDISIFF